MKRKSRYQLADSLSVKYAASVFRWVAKQANEKGAVEEIQAYLYFAYLSGYDSAWRRAKADARKQRRQT